MPRVVEQGDILGLGSCQVLAEAIDHGLARSLFTEQQAHLQAKFTA